MFKLIICKPSDNFKNNIISVYQETLDGEEITALKWNEKDDCLGYKIVSE